MIVMLDSRPHGRRSAWRAGTANRTSYRRNSLRQIGETFIGMKWANTFSWSKATDSHVVASSVVLALVDDDG